MTEAEKYRRMYLDVVARSIRLKELLLEARDYVTGTERGRRAKLVERIDALIDEDPHR